MKKKIVLSSILILVFAVCLKINPLFAWDSPIYEEGFDGSSGWSAENGVWEVGVPTVGPEACHGGSKCAGTILGGNYPDNTDSRLIVPYQFPWEQGVVLPELIGNEEIQLRFWQWFSYSNYDYYNYYDRYDKGHVQISVYDEVDKGWSDWQTLSSIQEYSPVWTKKDVDLSVYAGQKVRIAFYHTESRNYRNSSVSSGWYIDDVQIVKNAPPFTGDFESGWGGWSAENGLWQVGTPAAGPDNCFEGTSCAGTVLGGNYPSWTDSRLISPAIVLSDIASSEELHLRFWQWFSYSNYDYYNYYDRYDQGHVQISVYDEETESWSDWQTLSSIQEYSPVWTKKDVDLSAFAGQKVRIAFYHTESRNYRNSSVSSGWYIDDVQIVKNAPPFTGDFESGWGGWSAENGLWQVGPPAAGPDNCFEGTSCAGTVLGGNYPSFTDSRLVSAAIDLSDIASSEELHLRFWQWFSYSNYNYFDYYDRYDQGHVQISVYDEETESWSDWQTLSSIQEYSPVWSKKDVDLSVYAGQKVRIAFYHTESRNYRNSSVSSGWYIDDVQIVKKVQAFTADFELGWFDWLAENGIWQVGTPSSGPTQCYGGDYCAGTILNGNYPSFTNSRLVSATIDLSDIPISIVYMKFWEWFVYASGDYGDIQVSVWDGENNQWLDWTTLGIKISGTSGVWTLKYVDLSDFVGEIFRIGFLHVADSSSESYGWFIDNIEFVGPDQILPTISSVSYSGYIPDPCTSLIDVVAQEPFGGELNYIWQQLEGGTLVGEGENVEFIPPEIRVDPYTVRVAVSSNSTHISSFTKTLKIFTEVLYDLDDDDDIDGSDLSLFLTSVEVNATTTSRFAEEFGMIACEQ